jgi:hypothetical protein
MKKNKPEIGIITFWNTQDNYGQLLQCYALQQVLRQLGCDPFLIKYEVSVSMWEKIRYYLSVLFSKRFLKVIIIRISDFKIQARTSKPIDRGFDKFREVHLKSTETTYSLSELKNNSPVADYYVCGSDVIWIGYDEGYFLDWGFPDIPRIAYAPSFFSGSISQDFKKQLSRSLKKFAAVTVREESGAEICRQAGRKDAFAVPDPTLLLTRHDYFQLYSDIDKTGCMGLNKYLLLYLLPYRTKLDFDEIVSFAEQRGLKVVCVQANGKIRGEINKEIVLISPAPTEWLFLISNAEYILTNSFHGTVFSVIFNKKFGFCSQTTLIGNINRNSRMHNFLNKLNLCDRIINGDLYSLDNPIDYECVNAALDTQRENIRNCFKEWFRL